MQRNPSPTLKPLLSDDENALISTQPSWDQLRKEARALEGEIESKLATLTKIGQSTGLDNTNQEAEADELLKKVITRSKVFDDRVDLNII
jgi:Golgi SNAP receptor complex protein 1